MTSLKNQPIAALECPWEWIAARSEILRREGQAARAGAANTIEIQSINTGEWHRLTLPNDATHFLTSDDRDIILRYLTS